MPNYSLIVSNTGVPSLTTQNDDAVGAFVLHFTLHSFLDANVELQVALHQTTRDLMVANHAVKLNFVDVSTGEAVYSISGVLIDDENQSNSIVAVMNAMTDFDQVVLTTSLTSFEASFKALPYYNEVNSLGRKSTALVVPTQLPGKKTDLYSVLTSQDDQATVMYMILGDDLSLLMDMVRVANHLRVRLWVELDPTLTLDQAIMIALELKLLDHHICLLYSPILARPLNAVGLKGKKVARHTGGVILAEYLKRQANTNTAGIPAIHRPIAGFDYPISFVGIEQNPQVLLDDTALKALANVQLNVIKRERFPNGIRFILNDSLTTYGDNKSVLKLANASEISMLIDSRLIEISKRHLQKHIEGTIEDSLKECIKFLDACTTKERPLLRKSKEIGGFYTLSITPRDDRPNDAVDLECAYHPQGTGRAIYLKTTVTS